MLTAYAVTIGRTAARGWRVFVRSSSSSSSSATRKRYRREFQIHAGSVGDMDAPRSVARSAFLRRALSFGLGSTRLAGLCEWDGQRVQEA
jgi:hypothetical protein